MQEGIDPSKSKRLSSLDAARDMTPGQTLMTWSSETVTITEVAPAVRTWVFSGLFAVFAKTLSNLARIAVAPGSGCCYGFLKESKSDVVLRRRSSHR